VRITAVGRKALIAESLTNFSGLESYGRLGGQPFHGLAKREAHQGTARRSANPMPFPRIREGDIILYGPDL